MYYEEELKFSSFFNFNILELCFSSITYNIEKKTLKL